MQLSIDLGWRWSDGRTEVLEIPAAAMEYEHWNLFLFYSFPAYSCYKCNHLLFISKILFSSSWNYLLNEYFWCSYSFSKVSYRKKKNLIRKPYNPLLFSLRFFTQLAVLKLLHFRFPVKIKAAFLKLETECFLLFPKQTLLHSGVSTVTQPFLRQHNTENTVKCCTRLIRRCGHKSREIGL